MTEAMKHAQLLLLEEQRNLEHSYEHRVDNDKLTLDNLRSVNHALDALAGAYNYGLVRT